jgi:hypothetical protein
MGSTDALFLFLFNIRGYDAFAIPMSKAFKLDSRKAFLVDVDSTFFISSAPMGVVPEPMSAPSITMFKESGLPTSSAMAFPSSSMTFLALFTNELKGFFHLRVGSLAHRHRKRGGDVYW